MIIYIIIFTPVPQNQQGKGVGGGGRLNPVSVCGKPTGVSAPLLPGPAAALYHFILIIYFVSPCFFTLQSKRCAKSSIKIDLYNSVVNKEGTEGEEEIKKAYRAAREDIDDTTETAVDDKVSSALIDKVDAMLHNLEKEIDDVDAKIGDGWRLLYRDHDGKVTTEEVASAANYLKDTLAKDGIQQLISNLSKDREGKILVEDIVRLASKMEDSESSEEKPDKRDNSSNLGNKIQPCVLVGVQTIPKRARASVDMGNLRRNRTKKIARNHPRSRKGKGGAGSSSQTRDDFDADYNQRYGDAMSDEQLEQLLQQNQGGFFHQQDILQTIDEEELEDDDAEERVPRTVEDEVHGTPDDEEEEAEVATSSQAGGKSESVFKANFTKVKDLETEIWYATCKHCNKKYNLGISGGYGAPQDILRPSTRRNMRNRTKAREDKHKFQGLQLANPLVISPMMIKDI
ncbi:unnamed protein product [Cuscuta europaea]|uniref:EF-hand domain-containing protein n=3 Tax=Cuscuta europaea TaxID=41803 RepID=A0A9P0ZMW4_CUSEU|nr:unnamed protein product [Cuscuta europaea]